MASSESEAPDLSPAVTTVAFDPILPLLRVPIPAGPDDDPSRGPYLLAFKDEASWRRAWRRCEQQIVSQCEAVARVGCSLSASRACKAAWWEPFLPFLRRSSSSTMEDREACEEKAMTACLAASKQDGTRFARQTSDQVFAQMKIAVAEQAIDPRFTRGRPREKLVIPTTKKHSESCPESIAKHPAVVEDEAECSIQEQHSMATNFLGKQLMGETVYRSSPDESLLGSDEIGRTMTEGWEGGLIRPKVKLHSNASQDKLLWWNEGLLGALAHLKKLVNGQ